MKNPLPMVLGLGLIGAVVFLLSRRRRRKATPLERLRHGIEGALDDAEASTHQLRERAKKMRGDAKKRIEEQAHDLDERQKDLRGRLEELKDEAGKLLERSRP